jgi:hypothetical protein
MPTVWKLFAMSKAQFCLFGLVFGVKRAIEKLGLICRVETCADVDCMTNGEAIPAIMIAVKNNA